MSSIGFTVRGLRDAFAGTFINLGGGARRTAKRRETLTILAPHADLTDGQLVWNLFEQCMAALERNPRTLEIDVRAVRHADTKLAACLVAVYQMSRARGVAITMKLSEPVISVLELCRLDDLRQRTSFHP